MGLKLYNHPLLVYLRTCQGSAALFPLKLAVQPKPFDNRLLLHQQLFVVMMTYPRSSCSQGSTVFSLFSSSLFLGFFPYLALLPISLSIVCGHLTSWDFGLLFFFQVCCAFQQYGLRDVGFYLLESYIHQFQIFTEMVGSNYNMAF